MKFKVGDKVKFLNENGGGVVSKIISTSMVNVAIEDGFDIPVLVSDLVKNQIDEGNHSKNFFVENFDVDIELTEDTNLSTQETFNRETPIRYALTQSQGDKGVYLAFVPQQQQWLVTGLLDIYLYNNTDNELMFSIALKTEKGSYVSADKGTMKPKTALLVASIDREDLEAWTQGIVQILYIQETMNAMLIPGHFVYKIKPTKFYKDEAYRTNFLMNERAIIQMLGSSQEVQVHSEEEIDLKFENNQTKPQKAKVVKPTELIDNHKIGDKEAEVDLHISSLRDDYSSMKANEILNFQINYFERSLDNAIVNQYKRVVFIHGIGNGILRDEVRKILKEYDGVNVRNASFQQYGTGALEITIYSK